MVQHSTIALQLKSEHAITTRKSVKNSLRSTENSTHNHLSFETHNLKSPFETVFQNLFQINFALFRTKKTTHGMSLAHDSEDLEQTNVCREFLILKYRTVKFGSLSACFITYLCSVLVSLASAGESKVLLITTRNAQLKDYLILPCC